MKLLLALIANLPTILSILDRLDKLVKEKEREDRIQQKVGDKLKEIDKAIGDNDEEALRRALNS